MGNGRPLKQQQQPGQPVMTGIHKDTRGNIIGGYQDGVAFGTKAARQPAWRATPQQQAQPAKPSGIGGGGTVAATGNTLNARQSLFKQMEKAGPGGITPAMRDQARSLGVQDKDFNAAVARIDTNARFTPAKPTPARAPTATAGAAPASGSATRPAQPREGLINGMSASSAINAATASANRAGLEAQQKWDAMPSAEKARYNAARGKFGNAPTTASWKTPPPVGSVPVKPMTDSLVAGNEQRRTGNPAPGISKANPKGVNFTAEDVRLARNLRDVKRSLASRTADQPQNSAPATATAASSPPQAVPSWSRAAALGYGASGSQPSQPKPAAPPTAPKPPTPKVTSSPTVRFEGNVPDDASKRMREANVRVKQRRANATKFTDEHPTWRDTAFGSVMDLLSKPTF